MNKVRIPRKLKKQLKAQGVYKRELTKLRITARFNGLVIGTQRAAEHLNDLAEAMKAANKALDAFPIRAIQGLPSEHVVV